MKIENVVKEISCDTLSENERELIVRFRNMSDAEKIALMHRLYSLAFDGLLSEIVSEE